ncbi:TolC family protein [Fodinibius saliphilus]|uniref:TolC family protein n=1 Tax=Fodinibius saliphilus TaxID=1920650 RepID=UPI0014863E98|nr:TolC family protein [Fodinibius saliphilus]
MILLIISTVFAVVPLSAQVDNNTSVSEVLTKNNKLQLTEAIEVALANNSQIKRSVFSLKIADEEVTKAWSSVMPEVSGSASYTRNLEIPVNFVPAKFFDPQAPPGKLTPLQFGTDNNWQGGFSVQQTLFRGEAFVGISSSKIFKAAQAENLRATTQQVVTQTRLAYYRVLVAEEQLRLQEATVERLNKNLEENKARNKAGLVDEYAVLQVEVQLRNQQPQLTKARYAVKKAYRELKVILGIPLNVQFSVSGDLNAFDVTSQQAMKKVNQNLKRVDNMTPYQFQKKANVIDLATDLRGDVRVLEQQEELKGREIMAIKSRFLPTLAASYNLNWTASQPGSPVFFGTDETRARSQTLGFTLSLPIFQGFERSSNLDIAQIERKDIKEQKRATIRSAKNEIQSARESLNQALETAPARAQALELAQDGYQRAQARLENGMGSQLDVTNAELQLRQAEANYAQMVYDYLSAKAQYDQAIGMVPFVDADEQEINE